jgi:hypothetical protein
MLLNKIKVLDKGFVGLISSNITGKQLQDIQDTYFRTKVNMKLLNLCSATIAIKCPLFVQLNLSQYGFDIISTPSDDVEAFIPDLTMIEGDSLEDRQNLHSYVKATTEALILNQKGMPMDGADEFTAQMLTPVSTYNEIIVHGELRKWVNFLNQKNLPSSMENYRKALLELLSVEWKNIEGLMKILK